MSSSHKPSSRIAKQQKSQVQTYSLLTQPKILSSRSKNRRLNNYTIDRIHSPLQNLNISYKMNIPNTLNIAPPNSLVKYANPVLVSTSGKRNQKEKDKQKQIPQSISNAHREDILNSILPPREYTMDKQQLWIQSVSSTSATRVDVQELQEKLDKRLQQRQARETGICPIREELYAQCFDELIRQITINCAERGLLLVRVRDEIRQTIQAYQTLYESSIAYGMRKSLQSEQKKTDMQQRIKQLDDECAQLQQKVDKLETAIKETEDEFDQQTEQEEKQHSQEVDQLTKTNQRFKSELEKLLSGPSTKK